MSHQTTFNPHDKIGPVWTWLQSIWPLLRNRNHTIEIKEHSPGRSNTINAYYWKIVIPAYMTAMGIPDSASGRDYMHYDVLGRELRQIPDPYRPKLNNTHKTMTQQTSTMTGSEFWKYLNKCKYLFQHYFDYVYPSPINAGYDPKEWDR
jgi:hypothetical protein